MSFRKGLEKLAAKADGIPKAIREMSGVQDAIEGHSDIPIGIETAVVATFEQYADVLASPATTDHPRRCAICGDCDDNTSTLISTCHTCYKQTCDRCWQAQACHKTKGQKNDRTS